HLELPAFVAGAGDELVQGEAGHPGTMTPDVSDRRPGTIASYDYPVRVTSTEPPGAPMAHVASSEYADYVGKSNSHIHRLRSMWEKWGSASGQKQRPPFTDAYRMDCPPRWTA